MLYYLLMIIAGQSYVIDQDLTENDCATALHFDTTVSLRCVTMEEESK